MYRVRAAVARFTSRGESGQATREIAVSNFSAIIYKTGATPLHVCGPVTVTDYSEAGSGYSGSRIEFDVCDCTGVFYPTIPNSDSLIDGTCGPAWDNSGNIGHPAIIAATCDNGGTDDGHGNCLTGKRLAIARVGAVPSDGPVQWMYDAACAAADPLAGDMCATCSTDGSPSNTCTTANVGMLVYPGAVLPAWDRTLASVTIPGTKRKNALGEDVPNNPPQAFLILPAHISAISYTTWPMPSGQIFNTGVDRPRTACNPDPATCGGPTPKGCSTYSCGCSPPTRACPLCCTGPAIPCCDPSPQCSDVTVASTGTTKTSATCLAPGASGLNWITWHNGVGHFVIETFGKITKPVTFYLRLPYSQFDFVDCAAHGGLGGTGNCRPRAVGPDCPLIFTAQ